MRVVVLVQCACVYVYVSVVTIMYPLTCVLEGYNKFTWQNSSCSKYTKTLVLVVDDMCGAYLETIVLFFPHIIYYY